MSYCGKSNDDYGYDYESDDERLESLDALRLALKTAPVFKELNIYHQQHSECEDIIANYDTLQFAICVKNVTHVFNDNTILDNVCMYVPKGKIYALLGNVKFY